MSNYVARVNAIPARFTRNIEQRAALQREVDEALAEVFANTFREINTHVGRIAVFSIFCRSSTP